MLHPDSATLLIQDGIATENAMLPVSQPHQVAGGQSPELFAPFPVSRATRVALLLP